MSERPSPRTLALGLLGALFAVGYPLAVEWALETWGTRYVAIALLAGGLASLGVLGRVEGFPGLGRLPRAALLLLPALAAATQRTFYLQLVPAAIQGLVCGVFLLSLRGGGSLFQDAARWIQPYAPDFIGPYCRKATAAFALLFALQGAAAVALALRPPEAGWALATGVWIWTPVIAASGIEWLVRKLWFRYYGHGAPDRWLRRWFPPENTVQGRRSLAYIERIRRELGMPKP